MRPIAVACLLFGCGRVGFDTQLDGAVDALAFACPRNAVAPDPAIISGSTFEYTSFANNSAPVDGVAVTARDLDGNVLAQTTSDPQGNYSLSVPTGGVPQKVAITYARAGFFTTTVYPDLELDRDLAVGAAMTLWRVGDGPVWRPTAMDAVYSQPMLMRDNSRGTLNIAVRACDGTTISGVEVTITPSSGMLFYQNDSGLPEQLTGTAPAFAHVLVLNADPVPTTIHAMKAGVVFLEHTVPVAAGTNNTQTIVHAAMP